MKFLKTIRFDPSDTRVFDKAAEPDEWAIPGGIIFGGLSEEDLSGKTKQAFSNGFMSLESFGWSTFASVAELGRTTKDHLIDKLAANLAHGHGAPFLQAAQEAAQSEVDFVLDMCARTPINSLFTIRRYFDEEGEMREEFRMLERPPGAAPHARVWDVVED